MREFGSTSWSEMWSARRTQSHPVRLLLHDLAAAFPQRFALPSLEYEMSCLDHAVYHMDGPGQIRHLDDLLAIPNLHTIQWVPGAGQPPAPAWIEMLRKIQKAGKSVQVLVTIDELKAIYSQLAPEKTYYWVLDCPNEIGSTSLDRSGWKSTPDTSFQPSSVPHSKEHYPCGAFPLYIAGDDLLCAGQLVSGRRTPGPRRNISPIRSWRIATASSLPGIAGRTASATSACGSRRKHSNDIRGPSRARPSCRRRISSSTGVGASSPTEPSA